MECSCECHPKWKVLLSEVSCSPLRRSQQSSLKLKPSLSSIPTAWKQLEVIWDPLEISPWPLMSRGPKTQNHSQVLAVC